MVSNRTLYASSPLETLQSNPQPTAGGGFVVCRSPSTGAQIIATMADCQALGGTPGGPAQGGLPALTAPGRGGRWCQGQFGHPWFSPYGDCGLLGAFTSPLENAIATAVGPVAGTGASPSVGDVASGVVQNALSTIPGIGTIASSLTSKSFWARTGLLIAAAVLVLFGLWVFLRK